MFDELCCLGIVFPLGDHFGLEPPCELAQERGPDRNGRAKVRGPLQKSGGPPSCPSGPLAMQQFHINGAICDPVCRAPISRPYPHREPVLIGVPLKLLTPSRRLAREALQYLRPSYTRCLSFPQG